MTETIVKFNEAYDEYLCLTCKIQFINPDELIKHMKEVHI